MNTMTAHTMLNKNTMDSEPFKKVPSTKLAHKSVANSTPSVSNIPRWRIQGGWLWKRQQKPISDQDDPSDTVSLGSKSDALSLSGGQSLTMETWTAESEALDNLVKDQASRDGSSGATQECSSDEDSDDSTNGGLKKAPALRIVGHSEKNRSLHGVVEMVPPLLVDNEREFAWEWTFFSDEDANDSEYQDDRDDVHLLGGFLHDANQKPNQRPRNYRKKTTQAPSSSPPLLQTRQDDEVALLAKEDDDDLWEERHGSYDVDMVDPTSIQLPLALQELSLLTLGRTASDSDPRDDISMNEEDRFKTWEINGTAPKMAAPFYASEYEDASIPIDVPRQIEITMSQQSLGKHVQTTNAAEPPVWSADLKLRLMKQKAYQMHKYAAKQKFTQSASVTRQNSATHGDLWTVTELPSEEECTNASSSMQSQGLASNSLMTSTTASSTPLGLLNPPQRPRGRLVTV